MAAPLFDAAPTKGGSRGFLGTIVHALSQGGQDLANVAINSPAGFYHLAGGLIHDPVNTVENMGKATLQDFEHPLRHPGYTALDLLGLATGSGAILGRGAELGRVAAGTSKLAEAGGESVSAGRQFAQAALHGPPVPTRVIRQINKDTTGKVTGQLDSLGMSYSRNPTIRMAQQLMDKLHEAHPEGTPLLWKSQVKRGADAAKQLAPLERGLSKAEAGTLTSKYRKWSPELHEAVALVARGVMPKDQIQFFKDRLASGELKGRTIKETENAIARTEAAAKYIEPYQFQTSKAEYTLPKIKDEHGDLVGFKNDVQALANGRTNALREAGQLSENSDVVRTLGPKNIIEGHGLPANVGTLRKQLNNQVNLDKHTGKASARQMELRGQLQEAEGQMKIDENGMVAGHIHDPELAANLFRVPEVISPAARAIEGFTRRYRGGRVTMPTTLTHQYTGAVLKHGGGRWNVAETVAESYTEAARFLTLKSVRGKLLAGAKPTAEGIPEQWRLPIVVDWWRGKLPDGYQYPQKALEESAKNSDGAEANARWYEPLRQKLFEPAGALEWIKDHVPGYEGGVTEQAAAMKEIPGIKWIDRRQLGGLDKQNPLWSAMENPVVRAGLHTVDFINNVQKAMLLYMKPAYLLPNMLGNVALNLVQQGFLAPLNMGKTLKVMFTGKGLTPETVSGIKTIMGGGITQILESPQGAAATATHLSNKLANTYGKVIDDPFRFSAFLHEARLDGFTSKSQLHNLFTDPKYADKLREVGGRANDAIINYERLGPGEQAILRRLVFFYPWVKGSSRYTYQLAINHPVTASAVGTAGQAGSQHIEDTLGALPSYAEGLIPYSTKNKDRPTVGNPLSFSLLQQPADLLKTVSNLLHGNPNPDLTLASNLAPVDAGLLSLLTAGKVSTIKHPASQTPAITALHEVFGGNPVQTLYQNLTGGPPPPNSLYPDNSPIHALLRFFATGGLTPRTLNKEKANYTAYNETHPTGYTG